MNRIISTFLSLSITMSIMAADSYYYCNSKRIPLYTDTSKAIVMSPKSSTASLKGLSSFSILRSLSADTYDITLIGKNGTTSFSAIRKLMSGKSTEIAVYPCYMDEYNKPIIPTGYIYVKLKLESDYQKLQKAASEHGCRILRQNKFKPLWYTLQVTPNTDKDCVEIANLIYESGIFSKSCPSFAFDTCISS